MSSPPLSASPSSSSSSSRPALTILYTLFRRQLRISTTDGRVFLGTFVGTDKALNVLMVSTTEFRPGAPPSVPFMEGGRFVGQVMITWKRVLKVEVEGPVEGINEDEDMYT